MADSIPGTFYVVTPHRVCEDELSLTSFISHLAYEVAEADRRHNNVKALGLTSKVIVSVQMADWLIKKISDQQVNEFKYGFQHIGLNPTNLQLPKLHKAGEFVGEVAGVQIWTDPLMETE